MQFIVYFFILINLCTFIKESDKDHYCNSNINELFVLSSLNENIREINQWIGGDPNKNIKYELTYSKFNKKSNRMDHSLVKLKFLSSDTEGLNYFRDSNSEHSSSFNDYNDNLNNFDHLENINILSNFNNVVHFTDFSDFETNSILNNFNNFNVSNDNFNNFEHFDNINILSNFNNIVHFIDLVDLEAINTLNNFNNSKAFNYSNNFSNFN